MDLFYMPRFVTLEIIAGTQLRKTPIKGGGARLGKGFAFWVHKFTILELRQNPNHRSHLELAKLTLY